MKRFCMWLFFLAVPTSFVLGEGSDSDRRPATAGMSVAGPIAALLESSIPAEDPFPIYRVRGGKADVPNILKQPEAGPLVQLRRSDFEARVRRAGRVVVEGRTAPRLLHARYRASLLVSDLIGDADMEILNSSAFPQFLPLDPLRIALTHATWADGAEAIVGIPAGGSASVWVDRPGNQQLKFNWSAAGTMEFGERRFDLRVPSALSTNLDLELPGGQRPSVSGDVLLTGPFPIAGESSRSLWRIRFGGRSRLEFGIRSSDNSNAMAAASLTSRYELSPGQMSSSFEFDLRPAKGTVSEWQFLVEPGLRIVDVIVNNRSGWSLDPAVQPGGSRLLHVFLNQPGSGGKVLISSVSTPGDASKPAEAPFPTIRPQAAILEEENVEIRISPELKMEKWSPGDFRLVDSQFLADQTHYLQLHGTFPQPGSDRFQRQPPGIAAKLADPEFLTTERVDWRFGQEQVSVRLRLGIQVKRGPLFRVQLRPPAGYTFSRLLSPQEDLVSVSSGQGITFEFKSPLLTGQSIEFTLEFRGPRARAGRYSVPVFSTPGCAGKTGVLGVVPGDWKIDLKPGVGLTPTNWLDFQNPLPPIDAAAAFRYGGTDPDGELTLIPIRASFTATISSARDDDPKRTTSRISLHVNSGSLSLLFVVEPDARSTQRSWRVIGRGDALSSANSYPFEGTLRQFGLLFPGPAARLGALATLSAPSVGRLWVIRLAQPLAGDSVLETTASAIDAKASPTEKISQPSFQVWGAGAANETTETQEVRMQPPDKPLDWAFSGLYSIAAIRSGTEVEMVFGGTATASVAAKLPVHLPAGARLLTANVGGSWLNLGNAQPSPENGLLLPISARKPTRFEVRYQLPTDPGLATRIDSSAPDLPGGLDGLQRWWWFGNNSLPIWPALGWGHAKPSDLPALLGPSPMIGPGSLLTIDSPSQAWVCSSRFAYLLGVVLAVVLCLVIWNMSRRRHRSWWAVAVGAVLAFGLLNQMSDPWAQRATMIPLVPGLASLLCATIARGSKRACGVAVSATFLCAASALAPAQPPPPAVVVLLPAEGDGAESVVAPKAVLDRLNSLGSPQPPGVAITRADYSIAAEEAAARVVARYAIHSFSGADSLLVLPLSDARLEQVFVDGSQAFPAVTRPGVYGIPLPTGKRHEIEVHFSVSVLKIGPEREIRFGVPESPATRVIADLPGSARQVQCVGRSGKQTLTDANPRRLDVDAGNVRAVYVRWRDGIAGTAAIKVREACIWDIAEKGAELTACYLTKVEQGAVSGLRYELPAELEPVEISLRPVETTGTAALRDWSMTTENDGVRVLRLDLQGPTTERMLVVLTCRMKKIATRQPLLHFPKPLIPGGNPEVDALYAIRTRDVANKTVIDSLTRSGLNEESADALSRDREWMRVLDRRLDANALMQTFRPTPNANPEIRPIIGIAAEKPSLSMDTSWQVSQNRAKVMGTIRWTAKDPLSLLEFTIPGVRVLEVNSAEVREWNFKSGRVSMWFNKPNLEGTISWTGSLSTNVNEEQAVNPIPLEIQSPHPIYARVTSQTVRIRPANGFALSIERERGWNRVASPEWTYVFQSSNTTVQMPRVLIALAPLTARDNPAIEKPPIPRQPSQAIPWATDIAPSVIEKPALASQREMPSDPIKGVLHIEPIAAWIISVGMLVVLFLRHPRLTWPEQVGLVAMMLGITVAGDYWWVAGLFGWFLARLLWLVERNSHQSPATAAGARQSVQPEEAPIRSVGSTGA